MPNLYALIKDGDLGAVQRAVKEDRALLEATVTTGNQTPLMWALHANSGGRSSIAQWLIENGAKLDLQDIDGMTALMYACRYEQPAIAQLLIRRGAQLDVQNNDGGAALMVACACVQAETARMLVEHGAKLDLKDKDGWTALMFACCSPRQVERPAADLLQCVKRCWAGGADPFLRNARGDDALDIAESFSREDAVAFLEFVTESELASVLLDELAVPRSLVVNFYDENLHTLEACSGLEDGDLVRLGAALAAQRRHILTRLNPKAKLPRQSISQRASRRLTKTLHRLSGV